MRVYLPAGMLNAAATISFRAAHEQDGLEFVNIFFKDACSLRLGAIQRCITLRMRITNVFRLKSVQRVQSSACLAAYSIRLARRIRIVSRLGAPAPVDVEVGLPEFAPGRLSYGSS